MQQEDDLRALAKIMDFGRAVSIFLLVIHAYVYCYPSFYHWNLTLEVVDRILLNFNRTTGIFNCILWSKLAVVLLLAISCLGTIGVKGEKLPGKESVRHSSSGRCCSFSTGGCWTSPSLTGRSRLCMSLLSLSAISVC